MKKFLIIDDDELFAKTLAEELVDAGYMATFNSDLHFDKIKSSHNLFDFILLDLKLKGETGLNLLDTLKKLWPDSYIVIMTGFGTIATAVNAIKLGASDYLTKPITIEKIGFLIKGESIPFQKEEQIPSLDRVEREYIEYVLVKEKGNISKAADKLGIHRQSLQRKLKKWVPFK